MREEEEEFARYWVAERAWCLIGHFLTASCIQSCAIEGDEDITPRNEMSAAPI